MKRLLTLLSWMLLLQTSVSAQHDGIIWNYEHLSRNDGLSGNRVTALCDDMYGRIWIGTSQGLNIYDGRRLQKVEEYNGLEVWSFHDAGDRILIGTTLFLGVYDYASGRFSRLTYEGRDVGYVRTIVQAGNDLLLKTPKQLFRCDGDRLTRVAEDTPYEYFCCDKFGQMWGLFKEARFPDRRGFQGGGNLRPDQRRPVAAGGGEPLCRFQRVRLGRDDQGRTFPLQPGGRRIPPRAHRPAVPCPGD
ncbi:MAG: hypothetical protein LUF83_07295 [Alistipes sp.]|nr:hypothetical protein [Alistipes sp.]